MSGSVVAAAITSVMDVAAELADGRLAPAALDATAVDEARALFGTVAGPEDPLWGLQCDVARQVLAAGGVTGNELQEWLAVQRAREGWTAGWEAQPGEVELAAPLPLPDSWIERVLAAGEEPDEGVPELKL